MGDETVVTDKIRNQIGKDISSVVWDIEKGAIRKVAEAIGDPNPLWQDEEYAKKTRFGGIIAPPTFLWSLRNEEAVKWANDPDLSPVTRFLHGGTDFDLYQPVRPGDRITVTSKLVDAFEREGKSGKMLTMIEESRYTNQKGELVAKATSTLIRR